MVLWWAGCCGFLSAHLTSTDFLRKLFGVNSQDLTDQKIRQIAPIPKETSTKRPPFTEQVQS